MDLYEADMKNIYNWDRHMNYNYAAASLIDGDPTTFANTDLSNTGMWLRVFLGYKADISRIEIHNREDCCKYRLQGYTVYIRLD